MVRPNRTKPIYIQISEWLETEILKGTFGVHDKVYSQYQLADRFTINPATAAKGLTRLAEEGILYDKRGLGKFVSPDAIKIIRHKRKNYVVKKLMKEIVQEGLYLNISEEELISLLKNTIEEVKGDDDGRH